MARNRKTQSGSIRLGPALKACVFCLFVAVSGIGYVGQKSQLQVLAGQYRELEKQLQKLRTDNVTKARVLDALQASSELENRIKQMNLGMIAPPPDQIVRLRTHPLAVPLQSTNQLYAHRLLQHEDTP